MNQILNPRFSSMLTRVFAIKSAGSPMPTMAPELAPGYEVNNLDDLTQPFLRGERLAQGCVSAGAPGAGNYTRSWLSNPINSNTLLIVRLFDYWTQTVGAVGVQIFSAVTNPTPTGSGTLSSTDTRWHQAAVSTSIAPVGKLQYSQTAVAPNLVDAIANINIGLSMPTPITVPLDVVLKPGSYLQLTHTTITTPTLVTNFWWREKPLQAEESATG